MSDPIGCGNHGCIVARPTGMATNGPCRCADWRGQREIHRLRALLDREREEARAKFLAGWRAGREAAAQFAATHRMAISNLPPYLIARPNEPPMQNPTEVQQAFADAIRALPEPGPCTPMDSE